MTIRCTASESDVELDRPAVPGDGVDRLLGRRVACVIASRTQVTLQGDSASDAHKPHGGLGKLGAHGAPVFSPLLMIRPAINARCAFVNS